MESALGQARSLKSASTWGRTSLRQRRHKVVLRKAEVRRRLPQVSVHAAKLADSIEDPVLRQAIKEPVAFWGGVLAGVLGLNLKEDPLRTWLERTSAEAGVSYQVAMNRLESERASQSDAQS